MTHLSHQKIAELSLYITYKETLQINMENNKYPGEIGGNQEKGCVRKHYKRILMFKRGDDKYI